MKNTKMSTIATNVLLCYTNCPCCGAEESVENYKITKNGETYIVSKCLDENCDYEDDSRDYL